MVSTSQSTTKVAETNQTIKTNTVNNTLNSSSNTILINNITSSPTNTAQLPASPQKTTQRPICQEPRKIAPQTRSQKARHSAPKTRPTEATPPVSHRIRPTAQVVRHPASPTQEAIGKITTILACLSTNSTSQIATDINNKLMIKTTHMSTHCLSHCNNSSSHRAITINNNRAASAIRRLFCRPLRQWRMAGTNFLSFKMRMTKMMTTLMRKVVRMAMRMKSILMIIQTN